MIMQPIACPRTLAATVLLVSLLGLMGGCKGDNHAKGEDGAGVLRAAGAERESAQNSISGAQAEEFTIGKLEDIGGPALEHPVLSPDERSLAYIAPPQNGEEAKIVVVRIPTGEVLATGAVVGRETRRFERLAWSPDGAQVFVAGRAVIPAVTSGWILKVAEKQLIPLGTIPFFETTRSSVRESEVLWTEPQRVHFFPGAYPSIGESNVRMFAVFDLETLTLTVPAQQTPAQAVQKWAEMRRSALENPIVELGTTFNRFLNRNLAVFNRDGSYAQVLTRVTPESTPRPEWWIFAPSGRFAIMKHRAGLRLFTLAKRERPQLSIDAVATALQEQPNSAEISKIRTLLASETVFVNVYPPQINPLNGRVVGHEGELKGVAMLTGISDDGTLRARYVREEAGGPAVNDVLSGFTGASKQVFQLKALVTRVAK